MPRTYVNYIVITKSITRCVDEVIAKCNEDSKRCR